MWRGPSVDMLEEGKLTALMQEMLGIVFLSNGRLQALHRSQNSSCPVAVKSSLVVIVIVVTHTHETSLWVRPCTWGLLTHSRMCARRPTGQGVGTKENHRLPPRLQSHNGHNKGLLSVHFLLTPDAEIYQEGNPQ